MLSSPPVLPINVEKSYRRLLNHLPGMAYRCRILNTDADENDFLQYELEFVSRGSYELLGVPAEDMVLDHHNTIERMTHPDDLGPSRKAIRDSIVAHEPYQVMYWLLLPSGGSSGCGIKGRGCTTMRAF